MILTPVPEDVINVKAELLDIRRALVENESISSEHSVAKFQIQSTEVPKKRHASRIVLKYNDALLKVPLEVGRLYTFRFQDDGSFFDIAEIELPY